MRSSFLLIGIIALVFAGGLFFAFQKPATLQSSDEGASAIVGTAAPDEETESEEQKEDDTNETSEDAPSETDVDSEKDTEETTEDIEEETETESQDENAEEASEPDEESSPESSLEIVDKLLPLASSKAGDGTPYSHIMLHFTSDAIRHPEDPHSVEATYGIFSEYGVGSHYYVARDGTVYQFTDESRKSYHAGKGSIAGEPKYTDAMNDYAIGIEIAAIGTQAEMREFFNMSPETYAQIPESAIGYTSAQYDSLAKLLHDISERRGIPYDGAHIIGHDEYASARKTDPGELFDWAAIGL